VDDDEGLGGRLNVPETAAVVNPAPPDTPRQWRVALSAVGGTVLGAAPHVLHHAGPVAGAAILAGAAGTILFGILGLLASIPLLLRLQRRTGSWRVPAVLLSVFAAAFVITTVIVGPALSDDERADDPNSQTSPAEHEAHHQ
jgi:hypothetical protein